MRTVFQNTGANLFEGRLMSIGKSMTMIVSRGLARESTRLPRIFNRPELVIVNLR